MSCPFTKQSWGFPQPGQRQEHGSSIAVFPPFAERYLKIARESGYEVTNPGDSTVNSMSGITLAISPKVAEMLLYSKKILNFCKISHAKVMQARPVTKKVVRE